MHSKRHKREKKAKKKRKSYIRHHKRINKIKHTKESRLLLFFSFLFFVIVTKLFFLQVIKAKQYEQRITQLHYKESTLQADRGHIYIMDKNEKPLQLTQNITVYDLYIEPQHLKNDTNKEKLIDILTPYIYKHLCIKHGIKEMTKESCTKNIEVFARKNLLPEAPEFFYMGSGSITEGYFSYDRTGYNEQYSGVVNGINETAAKRLIKEKLSQKIYIGTRESNYLGFFEDEALMQDLKTLDFVETYNNYAYIKPSKVSRESTAERQLESILKKHHKEELIKHAKDQIKAKPNTYVKIAKQIHPEIAAEIIALKKKDKTNFYDCYYNAEPSINNCDEYLGHEIETPLLHGLGLEEYTLRHYPYHQFLSHVIGYVNKNGSPTYGIEEYMQPELRGKDGKLIGRSSSFIGEIGANEFDIENVVNGDNIYLTINPTIQKETEEIAERFRKQFKADSVSVVIMDPFTAEIKAHVNAPAYNPNNFNDAFTYIPLSPEYARFIDDTSYTDIHLYIKEGDGKYRKATTAEREDPSIEKYMTKNIYSSEVFVDKNIKYAYEPGSIMKGLTVAIGADSDEIDIYDFYEDKGSVKVGPYTIANVSDRCLGENNFLNALVYSCNVGMVRIVQAVGKEIYYNYIKKLGFGKRTNIQLAGEEDGFVEPVTTVSLARFLNNSFGLGIRATPIQVATAYASVINGGYLLQPSIIAKRYDTEQQEYVENKTTIIKKIFKEETTEVMKQALFDVINLNKYNEEKIGIEGYTLAGKSGTSEITYKGRYQTQGHGRTNASFVGVLTKENPQYVVVIQVRRPRTIKRGSDTAGVIFKEIAKFIINYDLISK